MAVFYRRIFNLLRRVCQRRLARTLVQHNFAFRDFLEFFDHCGIRGRRLAVHFRGSNLDSAPQGQSRFEQETIISGQPNHVALVDFWRVSGILVHPSHGLYDSNILLRKLAARPLQYDYGL